MFDQEYPYDDDEEEDLRCPECGAAIDEDCEPDCPALDDWD